MEIEVIDDKAVLMPKKLVDKSQAYFWTKCGKKRRRRLTKISRMEGSRFLTQLSNWSRTWTNNGA